MSRQMPRIGFVGAGSMGQCAHLRDYALLDGCQVVASAEIREDLRREVAELSSDPGQGACPQTVIPQLPWVDAMRQQAIHFPAAIRGEVTPPCEAAEALEDLRVTRSYIQMLAAA
jgi:hypothetical protein